MSRKLFVGSLSWHTSDQTLAGHFREFGQVEEAKVVLDRETGKSRGFGFVTMDTTEAAGVALNALDGSSLDGRSITVSAANERRSDRPEPREASSSRRSDQGAPGEVEVYHKRRSGPTPREEGEDRGGMRTPKKRSWR